jgi:hypothetical protein
MARAVMAAMDAHKLKRRWDHEETAPHQEVLEWMKHVKDSLQGPTWEGDPGRRFLPELAKRLMWICVTASVLSLGPVVFPFGNPYDLSFVGFLKNSGYFVGYCGVGWSFLWMVNSFWVHRLLNVSIPVERVILAPTLFAIVIFFVMYIVVGGPAPLGTLSVGFPCFLFSWWSTYKYQILPQVGEDQGRKGQGVRVILTFVRWVVVLICYAAFTIALNLASPTWVGPLSTGFVFVRGFLDSMDVASFVYRDGPKPTKDQALAAMVMHKVYFIALHVVYQSFLFPVLTDLPTVVFTGIVNFLLDFFAMQKDLGPIGEKSFRGSNAADKLASGIYNRFLDIIVSTVCPLLFAVLLAFNHWSWNGGLFFTISGLNEEAVITILQGIGVCFFFAVLRGAVYLRFLHVWFQVNSTNATPLTIEDIDLSEFTVLRALYLAKDEIEVTLTVDQDMRKLLNPKTWVSGKPIMDPADASTADQRKGRKRGLLGLTIMSLAASTTIVGVCMVMKHDGMDLAGWAKFTAASIGSQNMTAPPYKICPFLGECYGDSDLQNLTVGSKSMVNQDYDIVGLGYCRGPHLRSARVLRSQLNSRRDIKSNDTECATTCSALVGCVGYAYSERSVYDSKCVLYGPDVEAVEWEGYSEAATEILKASDTTDVSCMWKAG